MLLNHISILDFKLSFNHICISKTFVTISSLGVAALGHMMLLITPINCVNLPGNCNPAAYYISPIHRNAIVPGSFSR